MTHALETEPRFAKRAAPSRWDDGDAPLSEFKARKRADQEADRLRAEFFALVSHELRSPMTSIIGYLELLEEGDAVEGIGRHCLDVISRNAARLGQLADDLLLVSEAEAGTFMLDLAPVDLAALARDSLQAATPGAEHGGLELLLSDVSAVECTGDAERLAQVLDNLISNAVKFTPRGGRIELRVRECGGRALIEVEDTGPGICPAELRYLFDRFFRAAGARQKRVQGVGLGLAVAQAIVEAHAGRIEVESTAGKGSVFRVALPLTASLPG
jgi:signal transduction histidine kinase